MAEVYKTINGKKFEKWLAYHPAVGGALRWSAIAVANQAKRNLAKHRFEGESSIGLEKGKLDYYVVLQDKNGTGAAWGIEFGRQGQPRKGLTQLERYRKGGGMKGLRILRDAAGV